MPDEGTTNVFELADDSDSFIFDDEAPDFQEETEAPAQPAETEPAPEPPTEQAPEPEAPAQPEAEGQPEPPAPEPPPAPETYLGTYRTREDAERGYGELRAHTTRTAQENATLRAELERAQGLLKQVEPLIQQQAPAPQIDLSEIADNPELLAQYVQAEAQRQAQRLVAPMQEQIRTQQENHQRDSVLAEIQRFRQNNPESFTHDLETYRVLQKYQQAAENPNDFPLTSDNLQAAYVLAQSPEAEAIVDATGLLPDPKLVANAQEVIADPALKRLARIHPHLLLSDDGMEWMREQAGQPAVIATAQANAQTAQTQAAEAQRRAAHVETDEGSPAPGAPGTKPRDALEEALFDEDRKTKSIFGV